MTTSRRDFMRVAATSTGALGLGILPSFATRQAFGSHAPSQQPKAKLRILVLGGTSFIGPYQVQYALDRGHTITLFNRGKTNPQLFPGVEKLIGDRNGDLKSLEGREWDVVIDNSATQPKWVELTAGLLQKTVKRYVFTSTRSVYFDTSIVPMTAAAPVYTPENTKVEPGRDLPYGLAKAESEKVARKYFPNGALIVRPSLIVGPGDLTDRYTYWPVRIERGGEVLAPGDGSDRVQVIDVRDLCEWMIRLCENGVTGTYNGLGPKNGYSFAELLHGIKAVTSSDATLTWVDTDFLTMMDVRGYREMPVWQPSRGRTAGFGRFDITPELALGLTFRPLAVTAKDTLDYYHAQPADRQATLRAGITPEREKEVLAAWKARAR
ncbi:MAG TPA: NAD-dependent epimerase/dehydratase family protein [Gemmatimonadaceae bacterium]|jgi:2'-hydroxyisoflavone reductase|nr:NAD-dependent epimerase/dehydratase family protein [Gemmatimonadaceae bacterium]